MKTFYKLLLLGCAGTPLFGAPEQQELAHIERSVLEQRAKQLGQELTSTYRKRYVGAVVSAILAGCGTYMLYHYLPALPTPSASSAPAAQAVAALTPEPTGVLGRIGGFAQRNWTKFFKAAPARSALLDLPIAPHVATPGIISRAAQWVGNFAKETVHSVAKLGPSTIAISGTSVIGSSVVGKVTNMYEHAYRPLNWGWMLVERSALLTHLKQLITRAAVLDCNAQFEELKNVHINWTATMQNTFDGISQEPPNITAQSQQDHASAMLYQSIGTIDDLIKLQTIAHAGRTRDEATRKTLYNQFIVEWTALVDALSTSIGYVMYKSTTTHDVSATMRDHLSSTVNDLVLHTNTLAAQLPDLMPAQGSYPETSTGLLQRVYAYGKIINDLCMTVGANAIIS